MFTSLIAGASLLCAAPAAPTPEPVVDTDPETPVPQSVVVQGESDLDLRKDGETWRAGPLVIEAALPVGYPAPTLPGVIEIKAYPGARRATYTSTMNPDRGSSRGFWPLFNHIKDRDIPMTSPVEVAYLNYDEAKDDTAKMQWEMSFLYQSTDVGKIESDEQVSVNDSEPVTVVAIGQSGQYGFSRTKQGMARLKAWLADNPEWEAAGPPRSLSYNGPYIRVKWSEMQIPVRPVARPSETQPAPKDADAS